MKRQYPESARFHVHAYEINSVTHLILGPEMDGPEDEFVRRDDEGEFDDPPEDQASAEQNPDDELNYAIGIIKQAIGTNQTAIEALDVLLKQASGIPGPPK